MAGKFKIVMSDLHLSAGRAAEGNLLEDFASDQEFSTFLEEVAAESEREGAEAELIFNGDVFEMLQVPHVDAFNPTFEYPPKSYHSSSEKDSDLKMALIIDGHQPFFEALGRFMRVGPPRRTVTFVKGNHDLNLHWPDVQARIRDALGARSGRHSLVTFVEQSICREGIYVEHGNQYAGALNRVQDMEDPRDRNQPTQLDLPLGSWFVMDVFNKVERDKYWIDGVKPITALVWYALEFDFPFALRAIARLVGSLPGILWEGLRTTETTSADAMVRSLADPSKVEELAGRYRVDESFRAQFNVELAELLRDLAEPEGEELRSARSAGSPVEMGNRVRSQVKSSLFDAAVKIAAEKGVKLVTFGHTHDAGVEQLPGGAAYINSGTWTWRADWGCSREAWQELFAHPERFTDSRLLSYVRIDYDAKGRASGRLLSYETGRSRRRGRRLDGGRSVWHRIGEWLRRLGEFFDLA